MIRINPQGSELKLIGIVDTQSMKEAMLELRTIIRNKNISKGTGSAVGFYPGMIELLKEIRDF